MLGDQRYVLIGNKFCCTYKNMIKFQVLDGEPTEKVTRQEAVSAGSTGRNARRNAIIAIEASVIF